MGKASLTFKPLKGDMTSLDIPSNSVTEVKPKKSMAKKSISTATTVLSMANTEVNNEGGIIEVPKTTGNDIIQLSEQEVEQTIVLPDKAPV